MTCHANFFLMEKMHSARRLEFVDSLRAIAALAVTCYHLPLIALGHPLALPKELLTFLQAVGGSGVDLFFALSAFLLCMLMPSYERNPRPTLSFYLKRFFRIAPLFYLALVYWITARYLQGTSPDWRKVLYAITFTFNLNPSAADGEVFAGWTVGVEMLFYAIFPFLFRALPGWKLKVAALLLSMPLYPLALAVFGYLPFDDKVLQRYQLLTIFKHLPVFLLGLVAFEAYERLRTQKDAFGISAILVAGAIALLGNVIAGRAFFSGDTRTLGWALLIVGAGLYRWPFINPVMAFLGRISYSIYLLHGPIIISMGGVFLAIYGWGAPTLLSFLMCVALALAVIVPISWLSFVLIETPGNRLGSYLVTKLRAQFRTIEPVSAGAANVAS